MCNMPGSCILSVPLVHHVHGSNGSTTSSLGSFTKASKSPFTAAALPSHVNASSVSHHHDSAAGSSGDTMSQQEFEEQGQPQEQPQQLGPPVVQFTG